MSRETRKDPTMDFFVGNVSSYFFSSYHIESLEEGLFV